MARPIIACTYGRAGQNGWHGACHGMHGMTPVSVGIPPGQGAWHTAAIHSMHAMMPLHARAPSAMAWHGMAWCNKAWRGMTRHAAMPWHSFQRSTVQSPLTCASATARPPHLPKRERMRSWYESASARSPSLQRITHDGCWSATAVQCSMARGGQLLLAISHHGYPSAAAMARAAQAAAPTSKRCPSIPAGPSNVPGSQWQRMLHSEASPAAPHRDRIWFAHTPSAPCKCTAKAGSERNAWHCLPPRILRGPRPPRGSYHRRLVVCSAAIAPHLHQHRTHCHPHAQRANGHGHAHCSGSWQVVAVASAARVERCSERGRRTAPASGRGGARKSRQPLGGQRAAHADQRLPHAHLLSCQCRCWSGWRIPLQPAERRSSAAAGSCE